MPRPPRFDAPGAVHHVWARAVEGRPIFASHVEARDLLRRIAAILLDAGHSCFAWVVLSNHFHAVIRSGHQPLSAVVHRVQTGFAVSFNRRLGRQGHVFQSRFGSRLVRDDADLMGMIRYVHRNPLKAGLVRTIAELADYPWCGHAALVGRRAPFAFEAVADALSLFGGENDEARERLIAFMEEDVEATDQVSPIDLLIRRVCMELGVAERDLLGGSRRAATTFARTLVCQRAVRELGIRNSEVARALGVTLAAVTQALRREKASF